MVTRERQSAFTEIIRAVNSTLELDQVLCIVMDYAVKLTGAERGFLMLRDVSGEMLTRTARNWEQESIELAEQAFSHTIVQRVIEESESILTTNAQDDIRFGNQESVIIQNLRSILCVPLKAKGVFMGVIYVDNRVREGIFNEAERDLLGIFADHAAVAIENARLYEAMRTNLSEVTKLHHLMENVFSSIVSGVITIDQQYQISLCNQAAQEILQLEKTSILQKSIQDVLLAVIGKDGLQTLMKDIHFVEQNKINIIGKELIYHSSERGKVILQVNISPLNSHQVDDPGIAIVINDMTENKRLEAQKELFDRMVSPKVIQQLDPDRIKLGGERHEISILFADLRGFTHFSETVPPEQLVTILNRYIASAADAILEEYGTIDKFQGDAVMAWFNAPILQEDHILRAIRAALSILASVQRLKHEIPESMQLSFGIGVHTGEAILGLIGTERRVDYTAIGDAVNTAKRLQEHAISDQILISEVVYEQVKREVEVREAALILAKGKREPVKAYELVGMINGQ